MSSYCFPDLGALVLPKSVVIVGASERRDSIGGRALMNVIEESDFQGDLYLVNPSRTEIAGRQCWPSVSALPATPQLAVITVPAAAVLGVLRECVDKGIGFAIVFTAGFSETDEEGRAAEARISALIKETGIRVYGPNSPGFSNMNNRLGFTFSPAFKLDLKRGPLGLATQGGGLGRSVLQSMERGAGVGLWFSAGNEVDLEVSDFIHYMAGDPGIRAIVLMLEGIKDGRKFIAAAQYAAQCGKPVVAIKVGKSEYGIKAAQSHTAAIAGSAEVNSAVFRQLGIVEVDDTDELADAAWLLARRTPSGGEKFAVFCFSGGAAALAADMMGVAGLKMAEFEPATRQRLSACLPAFAPMDNPVDTTAAILADMSMADDTLQAIADDPNVGLVIYPFPMDYGEATTKLAESAIRVQAKTDTPILPVWVSDRMGGGQRAFAEAGIMPARSIGKAVKAMQAWIDYGRWRAHADPQWTPLLMQMHDAPPSAVTEVLSEVQGKAWLARHGIDLLPSALARSPEEACAAAQSLGYPIVAKVVSAQVVHKSDAGGVRVDVANADELVQVWHDIHTSVRRAHPDAVIDGLLIEKMAHAGGIEVMVGVHRDPVFGHVLTFGLGGIYVEIFKEVTHRLLPIGACEAAELVREMRFFPLLDGARGRPPYDVAALEKLLVKVSDFVARHADNLVEMDLNPVWIGPRGEGAIPLDAVIVRYADQADSRADNA